jgi:hypothetical protein
MSPWSARQPSECAYPSCGPAAKRGSIYAPVWPEGVHMLRSITELAGCVLKLCFLSMCSVCPNCAVCRMP